MLFADKDSLNILSDLQKKVAVASAIQQWDIGPETNRVR